ncbi:MAG: hypothetical protein JRG95_00495 [Deltaproteobacteria bacterium]|nr:hypothetical protein [Deltaproteobacteria bacterium]
MHWNARGVILGLVISAVPGCQGSAGGASPSGWLHGNSSERFAQVEKQLRGFDMAMVETGYRYSELYWAGQDQNWEGAAYQVRKLRLAIDNGLERRPKRAASAQPFLAEALPAMEEVVAGRDSSAFAAGFDDLTKACNACHAMEKLAFFEVRVPGVRPSPIEFRVEAMSE